MFSLDTAEIIQIKIFFYCQQHFEVLSHLTNCEMQSSPSLCLKQHYFDCETHYTYTHMHNTQTHTCMHAHSKKKGAFTVLSMFNFIWMQLVKQHGDMGLGNAISWQNLGKVCIMRDKMQSDAISDKWQHSTLARMHKSRKLVWKINKSSLYYF